MVVVGGIILGSATPKAELMIDSTRRPPLYLRLLFQLAIADRREYRGFGLMASILIVGPVLGIVVSTALGWFGVTIMYGVVPLLGFQALACFAIAALRLYAQKRLEAHALKDFDGVLPAGLLERFLTSEDCVHIAVTQVGIATLLLVVMTILPEGCVGRYE